jgi:uncharacterized membrane protein YdjX (TVP38/TMEM64 family)
LNEKSKAKEETQSVSQHQWIRYFMNSLTILSLIGCIYFLVYGVQTNLFFSETALEAFLGQFGIWAPIIFILFQAIQVIFPIVPGGLGLLAGVLLYGPLWGFILNYVGICLGSIAAFLLSKYYGIRVINILFSPKMRDKYLKWLDSKKFDTFFAWAIFFPFAPDDFLCYLAGLTRMTVLKFTVIILLGKPFAIFIYTFGLHFIFEWIVVIIR